MPDLGGEGQMRLGENGEIVDPEAGAGPLPSDPPEQSGSEAGDEI